NIAFADTQGRIGFRATGRIPRRTAPPPFGIPTVSPEETVFRSFLTNDEVPHLLSPRRGWLATANNRHWPAGAGLIAGRGYSDGFRATRIEELINGTRKHDLASMRKIQCDVQAVDARYLLPDLLGALGNAKSADLR